MAEFDYSQYDNDDDYTTVDAIYDMLNQADSTSRPMSILLECYNKYEDRTSQADAIANDKEALAWLDDYWEYVCWNEHGNEPSMDEVGGFKGMASTFYDADQYLDYLIGESQFNLEDLDDTAVDLAQRLITIASRYGGCDTAYQKRINEYKGVNKMKKSITVGRITFNDEGYNDSTSTPQEVFWGEKIKSWDDGNWHYEYWKYADRIIGLQWEGRSYIGAWLLDEYDVELAGLNKSAPSIHDMITQTRVNNNSLVKNRIDLSVKKNDAISNFITTISQINDILIELIDSSSSEDYEIAQLCESAGSDISDIIFELTDYIGKSKIEKKDTSTLEDLVQKLDEDYKLVAQEINRLYGEGWFARTQLGTKKASLFKKLRELIRMFKKE